MWKISSSLVPFWLLEAVRLKESQWGPIEDAVEVRRVIAAGGSLEQRLLQRAYWLSERQGWLSTQQAMWRFMRWSLWGVLAVFIVLGGGAAVGALTTTDGRVNVLWAGLTLLALPSLSFIAWLFALLLPWNTEKTTGLGVSQLWLWLSRRLIKGPDQSVLLNAFLSFLIKQRLWRWAMSLINHAAWLMGLSAMVVTLLVLLAAKRYSFNWETTLLGPESFVLIVQSLGWLPSLLGFSTPSAEMIRLSDGLQAVPTEVQVQWSSWLVGCVLVYGVLPRLCALALSGWMFRQRFNQVSVEVDQVGLIELRQRLMPTSEYVGVDAKQGLDQVPVASVSKHLAPIGVSTLVIGIELDPEQKWPPEQLPTDWNDAGLIDSREQRAVLLAQLTAQHYVHLVLCVDAAQTPDRGVIAWLAELASYSLYTSVCLLNVERATERLPAWRSRLHVAGFENVYTDMNTLFFELNNHHEI